MSHVNETQQNFLSSSVQIISKKYRVYFFCIIRWAHVRLLERCLIVVLACLYCIRLKFMHLCNYYKPSAKFDQAKCHFIYRSQFKLQATFCAVFWLSQSTLFETYQLCWLDISKGEDYWATRVGLLSFKMKTPLEINRKFSVERNENKTEAKQHTNTHSRICLHLF